MKEITPEFLAELARKVEGLIELEIGTRTPYVSVIFAPGTEAVALFTNRKDNKEVLGALEAAAKALREGQPFSAIRG